MKRQREIFFIRIEYSVNRTYKHPEGKRITESLNHTMNTTAIDGFYDRSIERLSVKHSGIPILSNEPVLDKNKREKKWIKVESVETLKSLGFTTYEL